MSITRLTTNGLTGTKYDTVSADNYYMEPIATTLLASSSGTITFSNIPQNYKHLQIRMISRNTGAGIAGTLNNWLTFNSDSGSNYTYHGLQGNGTAAAAFGAATQTRITLPNQSPGADATANAFGAAVIDILDYANTNKFKTVRTLYGANDNTTNTEYRVFLVSGLWMNTAAITSITLVPELANFATNSRFSLYGIKG